MDDTASPRQAEPEKVHIANEMSTTKTNAAVSVDKSSSNANDVYSPDNNKDEELEDGPRDGADSAVEPEESDGLSDLPAASHPLDRPKRRYSVSAKPSAEHDEFLLLIEQEEAAAQEASSDSDWLLLTCPEGFGADDMLYAGNEDEGGGEEEGGCENGDDGVVAVA